MKSFFIDVQIVWRFGCVIFWLTCKPLAQRFDIVSCTCLCMNTKAKKDKHILSMVTSLLLSKNIHVHEKRLFIIL